jgi:ADP-heptose:LPS heptosyltransferase
MKYVKGRIEVMFLFFLKLLFYATTFSRYFLRELFAKSNNLSQTLLLIRLDLIGDYILFRNFLSEVRASDQYKDYNITLLGNISWKDIAEELDRDVVDEFLWVDPVKFKDFYFRKQFLKSLWKHKFDIIINSTYSRSLNDDLITLIIEASRKIGIDGDITNINRNVKKLTNHFYTQIVKIPKNIIFEFDKNKFFFEFILSSKISIGKPFLDLKLKCKVTSSSNYIIAFIGASDIKRKWPVEKWTSLLQLILNSMEYDIVISGGPKDINFANDIIKNNYHERVINLTGKTNLVELMYLIQGSKILISNETSAVHIASAINIPSVCIIGGGHFGRFIPYSSNANIAPFPVFYRMDCYGCHWECKFHVEKGRCYPCIDAINEGEVFDALTHILKYNSDL